MCNMVGDLIDRLVCLPGYVFLWYGEYCFVNMAMFVKISPQF